MSVFSTQLQQRDQIAPVLDGLWSRLQDVSYSIDQVDPNQLDKEDQEELDAITRITSGYIQFVLEAGAILDTDEELPLEAISELNTLVTAHCDDCQTALSYVARQQLGTPSYHAVRVI